MRSILTSGVLVLNQNYEPLSVATVKRALGMILRGKAQIVENGRGLIHTPNRAFPCPSVVRLEYMVHRPRPRVKLNRKEIFRRDGYRCQYCGVEAHDLTLDHVVPRKASGSHTWTNLVSACRRCNRRKGGKTLAEARMTLRRAPVEPRTTGTYLYGAHLALHKEWDQFLSGWWE